MSERADHPLLRTTLGIVLPVAILAAALLPLWLFQARLPAPIASHWNLQGLPNGAMSLTKLAILITILAGVAVAGMSVLAYRRHATRGEISGLMAVAGFVGAEIAAMSWMTVAANLDAASWRDADHLGFLRVALALLVAIALAATVARLGRTLETASPVAPRDIPRAGLAPGARAVWVGSARAVWVIPIAIPFFVLAAFVPRQVPVLALGLCVSGVACLLFTSIRVTVDRNGLRIAYGLFGWPVQRIRLTDIRQASRLRVEPMAWGGWGYRGSLKVMRRAAVVLRAGEGIRLELVGDRTFVITVDGAEQGAGLINDFLAADARQQ
ncbi:MAG: hypothetical protein WDO12_11255 [Pseudomonadota bacterium]